MVPLITMKTKRQDIMLTDLLTVAKGRMTKTGAAIAAAGAFAQNIVLAIQGEEMLPLVEAAQGPVGSWFALVGGLLILLGGGRAAVNYGGK